MTAPSPIPLFLLAGGSGTGKTTLAAALAERHPWTVVHLDDYFKAKERVLKKDGRRNWDEPAAIDFEALVRDLRRLRGGEAVTVLGWPQTSPRDSGLREPRTVVPREAIILEGYLALWHPDVRAMASHAVFLDAPADVRHARRRWKMSPDYVRDTLEPMHRLHIEPTKSRADAVLDVSFRTEDDLADDVAARFLRIR